MLLLTLLTLSTRWLHSEFCMTHHLHHDDIFIIIIIIVIYVSLHAKRKFALVQFFIFFLYIRKDQRFNKSVI